jgi:hypothetical protein
MIQRLSQLSNKENLALDKPSDRDFRDALTRAVGATQGQETQALQWNRWSP